MLYTKATEFTLQRILKNVNERIEDKPGKRNVSGEKIVS